MGIWPHVRRAAGKRQLRQITDPMALASEPSAAKAHRRRFPMTATAVRTHTRAPTDDRRSAARPARTARRSASPAPQRNSAPIIVGVDGTDSGIAATRTAASLAGDLGAPLVLVSVRQWPSSTLGDPYYQRRLDAELEAADRELSEAAEIAEAEGVAVSTEVLEGSPAKRVGELARHRRARMIVLGPPRRRVGRSVSHRLIRTSDRPVVVADAAAA
jgi:nucleotide-binding universal stress UspA family protein